MNASGDFSLINHPLYGVDFPFRRDHVSSYRDPSFARMRPCRYPVDAAKRLSCYYSTSMTSRSLPVRTSIRIPLGTAFAEKPEIAVRSIPFFTSSSRMSDGMTVKAVSIRVIAKMAVFSGLARSASNLWILMFCIIDSVFVQQQTCRHRTPIFTAHRSVFGNRDAEVDENGTLTLRVAAESIRLHSRFGFSRFPWRGTTPCPTDRTARPDSTHHPESRRCRC